MQIKSIKIVNTTTIAIITNIGVNTIYSVKLHVFSFKGHTTGLEWKDNKMWLEDDELIKIN